LNNLSQKAWAEMMLKLGVRRLNKVADAGFEYRGFDIMLKDGYINEPHDTTIRYFEFEEYATKNN
jgi:hypothetical protein